MRVVRQILVGLGLIVLGVGGVVTIQGIVAWTQPAASQSALTGAIAITILGALFVLGGVALLVAGIRKRAPVVAASSAGADA